MEKSFGILIGNFEQLDGPIVASMIGQRFAVPSMRWGTARNNEPDQITARVFSAKSATPLITLSVPRSSGWGQGYFYGSYGETRASDGRTGALAGRRTSGSQIRSRGPGISSARIRKHNPVRRQKLNDKANLASPRPELPKLAGVSSPTPQLVERMLSWLPADTLLQPLQVPCCCRRWRRTPTGALRWRSLETRSGIVSCGFRSCCSLVCRIIWITSRLSLPSKVREILDLRPA